MRNRTLAILGLTGLLILLTAGVVLAQGEQLGGKLRTGSDIMIPAGETVDHDLYVFGGTVISNGTINGDVVAAGGTLELNGAVSGDVVAAGGRVVINGSVGGDVRTAGGQITIGGDVAEDILVAGGQVTLSGRVGEDLIVSTGELTLSGSVAGSTIGNVGAYTKTGTVTGSDDIVVTDRREAPVAPSNPVLDAIRQFVGVLLIAVLALWLVPRSFAAAEARVRGEPLPSFGWGIVSVLAYIVAIIVIVVLMVILAIVLGAFDFGALLTLDVLGGIVAIVALTLAFMVAAVFLADALVGLGLARLVAGRTGWAVTTDQTMRGGRWADLGLLAVGVAVVVILTSLPVVGWLVKLLVVFLGLGAMWLAWRPVRLGRTATMAAPPPAPTPPAG